MFSIPKKLKNLFFFLELKTKNKFSKLNKWSFLDSRIENGKRSDLDALLERVKMEKCELTMIQAVNEKLNQLN